MILAECHDSARSIGNSLVVVLDKAIPALPRCSSPLRIHLSGVWDRGWANGWGVTAIPRTKSLWTCRAN